MRYPPISLFTYRYPEREVCRVGFAVISILFYQIAKPLLREMDGVVEPNLRAEVGKMRWTSSLAFAGLAIVGLCPLQEDILSASVNLQSMVHQVGALCFFLCSMLHVRTFLSIAQTTDSLLSSQTNRTSIMLKYTALSLCGIPLLPSKLHLRCLMYT